MSKHRPIAFLDLDSSLVAHYLAYAAIRESAQIGTFGSLNESFHRLAEAFISHESFGWPVDLLPALPNIIACLRLTF